MSNDVKPAEATATPAVPVEVPATPAPAAPVADEKVSKPSEGVNADGTPVNAPKEGGEGKDAEKPGEPAKVIPEKYELKAPEGSLLPSTHLDAIAAEARTRGLSNEDAQKLVDRDAQLIASFTKESVEKFEKQREDLVKAKNAEWVKQLQEDPVLGGDGINQNVELAKRAFTALAASDKEIMDFVLGDDKTRPSFGNHPGFVRIFSKVGKMMSEDQFVVPGANASGKDDVAIEDKFYGSTSK